MSNGRYIDGVPFLLRKNFHPLPPFQFQKIVPITENLSTYKYDFAFEKTTISVSDGYFMEKDRLTKELEERRIREEAERRRQEELRKQENEQRQKEEEKSASTQQRHIVDSTTYPESESSESDKNAQIGSTSQLKPYTETMNPYHMMTVSDVSYPSLTNGLELSNLRRDPESEPQLLRPQLHCSVSDLRPTITSDNETSYWRSSAKLNLSDFESDAASPFDSVALTCLDDIRELEKVWANNMNLNTNSYPQHSQLSHTVPTTSESISQNSHDYAQIQQVNRLTTTIPSLTTGSIPVVIQQHSFQPITGNNDPRANTSIPFWNSTDGRGYYSTNTSPSQHSIPPIVGITPTTSHISSTNGPILTNSESFATAQFPYLSRFLRSRLPQNQIDNPPPFDSHRQRRNWNM